MLSDLYSFQQMSLLCFCHRFKSTGNF